MASRSQWLLLIYLGICWAWMDERPVLESKDGSLFISAAKDRNITLKTLGDGRVNVNGIDLLHVATTAESATRLIERWRTGYMSEVESNLQRLTQIVEGPDGLERRITMMKGFGEANSTGISPRNQSVATVGIKIRMLVNRVRRLEDKVKSIELKLKTNECSSNPCMNGGSCQDLYEGYYCHCPSNWEGTNCMVDVNECVRLLGTDLGCQNGATCTNLPGSYRCECAPGWFGLHCTTKTSVCNTQNSEKLCGHGVCVAKPGTALGYTCICDQGWQSDGTDPACIKDVDECAGNHRPCSVNPWVACRNAPGTFFCDSCPRGYTGNGYYCTDLDECLQDNGGCSTSPMVQCINTMGSRMCGSCPVGYRGDGVTCVYVGSCAINNGGCYPLATCVDNSALTSSYVICRCPAGTTGDGIGPNGCQLITNVVATSGCSSNPCVHGTCVAKGDGRSHDCLCNPGYTGVTCDTVIDPCTPNPCRNNGVCVVTMGLVTCHCPSTFSGSRCETPRQTCGGVSRNPVGHLDFPIGGNVYQHGLSCAWVLITNSSLVLNVTFTHFNLEDSTDCKYDFLQIHDGRNAGSQMIGRFCGNTFPHGNGNIVSSHNALYFWFHSDSSISHDGFSFRWNSTRPICGDTLSNDYGTISSPGSPGRYPPNRDCYWTIRVRPTKRIQIHFGQLMLEEHPTCENDFLEIRTIYGERLGIYCNHTHPPPLIVPTSEAVIYFHSDSAGQDAGFQIHYSAIEGIPGCSGVYTTPTGVISSPQNIDSFGELECEWRIQLGERERVHITWVNMNIASGCKTEYIEVYSGDPSDSKLASKYCSSNYNSSPSITTLSNIATIIFKSTLAKKGEFTLHYSVYCGGVYTNETGILYSPMYPNPFNGSRTCGYLINPPANNRIALTFLDVDLDTAGWMIDGCRLAMYDGMTKNNTRLDSGRSYYKNKPYYSTHNYMYLEYTCSFGTIRRGFAANYTAIPTECGKLFTSSTGTFNPPTELGHYRNDEHCIWTLEAPIGYVVQLTWLSFSLEQNSLCRHDYVMVYENYLTPKKEMIGKFCGSKKPPILMSQGNSMTIIFHSDSSITREGFFASYFFVDATKVCGGYFIKLTGVIKSPNYPDSYPDRKECAWVIEAPNRQRVILNIKDFQMERHSNCVFDYLEIRNGGTEMSPLIGKYCGTDIPSEIISQTNQLYIKFVSDGSRAFKGFMAEWDSTTVGCGGTLNAANGDIMSPNYPQQYSQLADCMWKIAVSAGSVVQLVILALQLEYHDKCRFDYIEISEGNEQRNKERYCDSPYPRVILTKSNIANVKFHSDYTTAGPGFHIKYETKCHNTLHGFHGVIESPNFPHKYDHNLNCTWIIDAPLGNRINITFSHFSIEDNFGDSCRFDYLEIMEGSDNVPETQLAKYCNTDELTKKIHSSEHQVFITFVTDNSIAYEGFRLEWVVDGCGGHLTRPFDSITSPGYPSGYPTNVDCEWLIEVDYSHSIELTIHDINTEKQRGCYFDKLEIFGGENEEAPKLVDICFSDKPLVYTSFGNKMFIKFHSDVTYAGRGFNASYKSVPITCGGKYTSDTGIILSTNYPKNYPNKQDCEWLLQVDKNHVVALEFLDFDIEGSRNCSDDYVQIYDGPTRESPLLGSHCRNELPPRYESTSNEMLVVMVSDGLVTAKGFKAIYSKACGARIVVKDQGFLSHLQSYHGSITDESVDYINCTWIFVAEDLGDHVTVTFTTMEVQRTDFAAENGCEYDYIEVFEGEGTDGSSRGKWCTRVPLPITSTGNALTVHLYSSYEELAHFSLIYTVLNSACGGSYTAYQGTIASPGYPNPYPLNSECIWIINNTPGNKLQLTFPTFELQQSEHCNLDYVEIRENNGIGKLLNTFCGTETEPVETSAKLWIKFKSDGDQAAKGFVGDFTLRSGNELTGPTGEITTPFYPTPYRQSSTIYWRITVEFGWVVQIEITDMFIENSGDDCFSYLKIYDGYDTSAPVQSEICGSEPPKPITVSSNVVYIELTAYIMRQGNWFHLNWIQIPRDSVNVEDSDIKLSSCSEEIGFTGSNFTTHEFSSPGWPHGYDADLDCSWLFTSPPGTHLRLRMLIMDLEESSNCIADYVAIYAGNALPSPNNARLIEKMCLPNATATWVNVDENVMTVKFHSDNYVNKTGFNAYVYLDCGGKLEGPNGVIDITNSSWTRLVRAWQFNCEWTVEVRPGRTIEVTIMEMSIHEGPSGTCTDNYLLLKNGGDKTSPLLNTGKYCGTEDPPIMETTGNRLYVKASGTRNNVHFKLAYREKGMNCGGEFRLTNKQKIWEISTPNYPNIPPPYSECTWTAISPNRDRISIHFVDRFDLTFTMNCEREYVEVRDGGTENSKLLGRFCKDVAPSSMTSTGNMIYVHYYTDISEPANGFKALISSGEACGGIIRGTSGIITSPGYPFFYAKNLTCIWLVYAPEDRTLKFEFVDIHLPGFRRCRNTDHLQINEETDNDTVSAIGTYCGVNKPDPIETATNKAMLIFKSDNFDIVTYRGFSLKFESTREVCGGEFTELQGIIKSHGYPNIATRSRYCDWRIKLPKGLHVVVEILDLNVNPMLDTTRYGFSLLFYNDFRFKSRIKVPQENGTMSRVQSSTNTMMIGYSSSPGYRGFKLRYYAEAPAPCGGVVKQTNGTLSGPKELPFNQSSFFCQWSVEAPDNMINNINNTGLTLSISVTGTVGGVRGYVYTKYCYNYQYITITGIGMLCGNFSEPVYLRSPKTVNELIIMNGTYGKQMNFNLTYRWQPCGGILQGLSHVISTPKNISYPINCVWHANYPDTGEMIKMHFNRLHLGDCANNYITVKNGGPLSPEIGRFCGSVQPYNITSTQSQLWIEYTAASEPNDFEFVLEPANNGCGGALRGNSREISSPKFPSQYPNNAECTWEITAENGYHIGLEFVDRFNLESSAKCEKDYVQVFDWINESKEHSTGSWKELGKVCGRETPSPFNSTSNRMKVIFRSNEAIHGDGFHAIWHQNCGGVFEVTNAKKTIVSPGYPNTYQPNLYCNYTLVAPSKKIIAVFSEFQLERSRRGCRFDNLTISWQSFFSSDEEVYCGDDKPPAAKAFDKMHIVFKTDKYVQRTGFVFNYFLSDCGGKITEPTNIQPQEYGEGYFSSTCVWEIESPPDKNIVLRFEHFVLDFTRSCVMDSLKIFDGNNTDSDRLAVLCGDLSKNLPVIRSTSNKMMVEYYSPNEAGSFSAQVLFVKSAEAGCGGKVNLSTNSIPFKTQKGSTYDSLEDCHWEVFTAPSKIIKFTINSIDVRNATNATSDMDGCSGDYLEVRDGLGPFSELLGRYCGTKVQLPIISTTNKLWIRFFSDGTLEGAGVTGTLETLDAPCQLAEPITNVTTFTLASPNYPNSFPAGVKCRWLLKSQTFYTERIRVHFLDLNLADSPSCDDNYLEITDRKNRQYIDEGFGGDFIWNGHSKVSRYSDPRDFVPMTSYKYCGNELPHDYYSYSSELVVVFNAGNTNHRGGFKFEYGSSTCDRNYTGVQGRIIHESIQECWITITAPVNHTISLYFNQFNLYDPEKCTKTALRVYEGDFNGNLLANLCALEIPSPIFSTGNKLSIHSWSEWSSTYEYYDITFTTTNEGRGCGGRLFNYAGTFSSPLYPNEYREHSVCTWDVSVPRGLKAVIDFTVLDIGSASTCNDEYNVIKLYDVDSQGNEMLSTTYCGGDDPAPFVATSERVLVRYYSSVNNIGTGWLAMFRGERST